MSACVRHITTARCFSASTSRTATVSPSSVMRGCDKRSTCERERDLDSEHPAGEILDAAIRLHVLTVRSNSPLQRSMLIAQLLADLQEPLVVAW